MLYRFTQERGQITLSRHEASQSQHHESFGEWTCTQVRRFCDFSDVDYLPSATIIQSFPAFYNKFTFTPIVIIYHCFIFYSIASTRHAWHFLCTYNMCSVDL